MIRYGFRNEVLLGVKIEDGNNEGQPQHAFMEQQLAFNVLSQIGWPTLTDATDALEVAAMGCVQLEPDGLFAVTDPALDPVTAAVSRQGIERRLDAEQGSFERRGDSLSKVSIVSPAIPGLGLYCRAHEVYEVDEPLFFALFDDSLNPRAVCWDFLLPFVLVRRFAASQILAASGSPLSPAASRWHAAMTLDSLHSQESEARPLLSTSAHPTDDRWNIYIGAAQPFPFTRLDAFVLAQTGLALLSCRTGRDSSFQGTALADPFEALRTLAEGVPGSTVDLVSGRSVGWHHFEEAAMEHALRVFDEAESPNSTDALRSDVARISRTMAATNRWRQGGDLESEAWAAGGWPV